MRLERLCDVELRYEGSGAYVPGALTTPTGATVLVRLAGVVDDARQRLAATFETDADELAWLNGELALFAGEVDHDSGTIAGRLYVPADESRPRRRS